MTQCQFTRWGELVWIEFSFSQTACFTKPKSLVWPAVLPRAWGGIVGFFSFPRELVQCEMQTDSIRIWTRVTVSVSYDCNRYTTGDYKTYILWGVIEKYNNWIFFFFYLNIKFEIRICVPQTINNEFNSHRARYVWPCVTSKPSLIDN